MSLRSLPEAVRAPWMKRAQLDQNIAKIDYAKDNGFIDYARNNAGTGLLPLFGSDANDSVHLAGQAFVGQRMVKTFNLATNAQLVAQAFWIADGNYTITNIACVFATADGAANTAFVGKATGTQAPSAAITCQTGTFNMNATAVTVQTAVLPALNSLTNSSLNLVSGERLCFKIASAVTSLAGVQITVTMTPGNKSLTAEYAMQLNSSIGTTTFFVSTGSYVVTKIQAIWSTLATNAGTVTYDVFKDTSTNAPGAGTTCLTAAVSVKTAINTVSVPALSATAATLRLDAGDRLSVKMAGTLTALAGLVVVVSLRPVQGHLDISLPLRVTAWVKQAFFTADRTYEFAGAAVTYSTAEGGALTANVTRESGVTAAGSGTSMQSGTFDLNTTTNTVQNATMLTVKDNIILAGDRLSINLSAGLTVTIGFCLSVKLIPR